MKLDAAAKDGFQMETDVERKLMEYYCSPERRQTDM